MINNSLQGDLQEAIRNALGCANSYEGDLYALCNLYGVADGAVSGRLIPVAQKHSPTIGTASGALNYLLQNPTILPSMGLNFVDGTDRLDSRVTFTRASNAWYFNSSGVLTQATTNTPRFDYDPSTLAPRGLLIEEQRTNSIRNNTMVGAVAGTPGTLPTNWAVTGLGTLTQQVVSTGVQNGINYVDIRFSGTTSTTQLTIRQDTGSAAAAASGQTWTFSLWTAVVGGSMNNVTSVGANGNVYDSGFAYVGNLSFSALAPNTSSTLTRTSGTGTIAPATTAFVQSQAAINFSSGVAIDITLRIGLPQLEQGAFATSVIPTSGAAATRAADVAVMTGSNFSSWYNQNAGTLFAEWVALLGVDQQTFTIQETAAANGVRVRKNTANAYTFVVRDPTTRDLGLSPSPALTGNQIIKVAGAYATNDVALSGGGQAVVTGATYAPAAATNAVIGGAAGIPYTGHIRRIAFYPRRLTNAELQSITA